MSKVSPSTGVWSNLKSPVKITVPTGVVMASEKLSAIEWVLRMNSTEKCWPTFTTSRGATVWRMVRSITPASSILPVSMASARRGP